MSLRETHRRDFDYPRRVRVLWIGVAVSTLVVVGVWFVQLRMGRVRGTATPRTPSRIERELNDLKVGLVKQLQSTGVPSRVTSAAERAARAIKFEDAALKNLSAELKEPSPSTTH